MIRPLSLIRNSLNRLLNVANSLYYNFIYFQVRGVKSKFFVKLRVGAKIHFERGSSTSFGKDVTIDGMIANYGTIQLGKNIYIGRDTSLVVHKGGLLRIGNNVWFNNFVKINCAKNIFIGNYCLFASNIIIYDNNNHSTDPSKRMKEMKSLFLGRPGKPESSEPIWIGENCWIGQNCVILKGAKIGHDSIVAAGAVVTAGSYRPRSLLAGNPAIEKKSY